MKGLIRLPSDKSLFRACDKDCTLGLRDYDVHAAQPHFEVSSLAFKMAADDGRKC